MKKVNILSTSPTIVMPNQINEYLEQLKSGKLEEVRLKAVSASASNEQNVIGGTARTNPTKNAIDGDYKS